MTLTARDQKIIELWNTGLRAAEIARRVTVSRSTVYNVARRARSEGHTVADPKGPPPQSRVQIRREKVATLWTQGFTSPQIADELGMTRTGVENDKRFLRAQGLLPPVRSRGGVAQEAAMQ